MGMFSTHGCATDCRTGHSAVLPSRIPRVGVSRSGARSRLSLFLNTTLGAHVPSCEYYIILHRVEPSSERRGNDSPTHASSHVLTHRFPRHNAFPTHHITKALSHSRIVHVSFLTHTIPFTKKMRPRLHNNHTWFLRSPVFMFSSPSHLRIEVPPQPQQLICLPLFPFPRASPHLPPRPGNFSCKTLPSS